MKEGKRLLIETSNKEVSAKKPARKVLTPTGPLPESSDESLVEGDSTIEDVPVPKNEMLEDEDISVETGVEDEEVEAEAPSMKNPISPEDRKLLEEGATLVEESKARRTEILKAWEPVMVQMVTQLNSMSAKEQLTFLKQVEVGLRNVMPPEVNDAEVDDVMALFIQKLTEHGFSKRY